MSERYKGHQKVHHHLEFSSLSDIKNETEYGEESYGCKESDS